MNKNALLATCQRTREGQHAAKLRIATRNSDPVTTVIKRVFPLVRRRCANFISVLNPDAAFTMLLTAAHLLPPLDESAGEPSRLTLAKVGLYGARACAGDVICGATLF